MSYKEWTIEEDTLLINLYSQFRFDDLFLPTIVKELNRSKASIACRANELGITERKRPKSWDSKIKMSKRQKERIKVYGHPRGALGIKHTDETKKTIGIKSKESWANASEERRYNHSLRASKNGHSVFENRTKATWKCGWRTIGGKRKYYRSRWEANYARYLEWLKGRGEINEWVHEPDTFWFKGIKRGCLSYLPDFKVIEKNGEAAYHEVKGWMDKRSLTKINRMAKYYPNIKLLIIDQRIYKDIAKKMSRIIVGWE